MMKQNYLDRAMRARDPRFAKIAERLGYSTRVAEPTKKLPPQNELAMARAEYERVLGKRPFMGWDAATLREKIAAASGAAS